MGCDIHLHIEVKLADHEGWQHYGTPHVPRDYFLFANMAGVRNANDEVVPIARPRGMPSDASTLTLFDHARSGDAHSASWLSAEEIVELRRRMKAETQDNWLESEALGYIFGNYPSDFVNEKPMGVEDLRFVFWFDN